MKISEFLSENFQVFFLEVKFCIYLNRRVFRNRPIVVLSVIISFLAYRSPLSYLLCFILVFVITCVSL